AQPTAAELRRAAIARKFDKGAGEGRLWGAAIDPATGSVVSGDGKIPGKEYLAYNDDGSGKKNVAMFLQVPDSFEVDKPCVMVLAPSSANRLHADAYAAVWGLRRRCAVASSDKGGGQGIHDLGSNKVVLIDGVTADADAAGKDSHYTSDLTGAVRSAYVAQFPNRISAKYYGKRNVLADQGNDLVNAARFAFFQLNEIYGASLGDGSSAKSTRFTRDNTLVILAGRSSGGGAVIKGAEDDHEGWFDGVVAVEPTVNPVPNAKVSVKRGAITYASTGQSLADFLSMIAIYMPCAGMADPTWPGYANVTNGANLCASLRQKGLIAGDTLVDQAKSAERVLVEYGFDPDTSRFWPVNGQANPVYISHAVANSYMGTGVERELCNFTVALTVDANGRPSTPTASQLAQMWVTAGTYAPQMIYEDSVGGPVAFNRGVSPTTGRADYSLDGALCLKALKTGTSAEALQYQAGERAGSFNGDLHGKPTLIVHGREDARVPSTLTSRMYLGLNSVVEGANSQLHYVELTNVSHIGSTALNPYAAPQAYYFYQALNLMWDHLHTGKPLPKHQVVRTVPRGANPDGSVPDLTLANVPPIVDTPAAADAVSVSNGAVTIPR
ncbi:MAG: D-(-)-3-hydroxybutyrate oligomer hydrolase, partial [Rhizobacter sp.]|nr:D-(-)-3-hydroxybutyrate oligomer hydrolase [Rhizobacter sp.]